MLKKAEILLSQFKSVFTKEVFVNKTVNEHLDQIKFDVKGVEKLLSSIKPQKAKRT